MKLKDLTKYLGLFIFAVAVIAVYKTFDNFGRILDFIGVVAGLLTPFAIGFGIAYVLLVPTRSIEKFLERRKNKFLVRYRRPISVATIYILFILAIVLTLVAIIPTIVGSFTDLYNHLPSIISDFVNWFNSLNLGFTLGDDIMQQVFENDIFSVQKLVTYFNFDNVNKYAQGVMNVGSGLFNAFMGIVISIYILIDRASLKNSIKMFAESILNDKTRLFILKYVKLINEFANKYIYCMLVDAIIIFIASFIIYSIEGVKYAPILALMLGLFNLIPYFGAITATVITGVITIFTGSLTLAIIAVVSAIILQQLDANYIQPRLLAGSLQIKPFWVIFGIILGGGLFGILGIFLAVPLTALFRSMIIDFINYRKEKASVDAYTNKKASSIEKPPTIITPETKSK